MVLDRQMGIGEKMIGQCPVSCEIVRENSLSLG